MPDFYVDHFVIAGDLDHFIEGLRQLASQGGGNLEGNTQFIRRGGNAANTASALHSLGMDPVLIATTDEYGAKILSSLAHEDLDLSHIHDDGRLSSTVSIEANHENRRVNLMVSDSGSAADFSFEDLVDEDIQALKESSLVALLSLNHSKDAPGFAHSLFSFIRESSSAKCFMDVGDPSCNPAIVAPLVKRVLSEGLVDILSINENEAGWFASALDPSNEKWQDIVSNPEQWLDAGRLISNETGVRVDLHTPLFAASIQKDEITRVPVFDVVCHVVCGAGDAWNAGTIYGTLAGMDDFSRVLLANALAALYVSSPTASHPSRQQIIEFLTSNSLLPT
ncbi:MAG: carbohydrate kinase family protein [Candidatus Hodarchaeota archaeon]